VSSSRLWAPAVGEPVGVDAPWWEDAPDPAPEDAAAEDGGLDVAEDWGVDSAPVAEDELSADPVVDDAVRASSSEVSPDAVSDSPGSFSGRVSADPWAADSEPDSSPSDVSSVVG
jgi:hypothetical protein